MTAQSWILGEPLVGVRLVAEPSGVWFRADGRDLTEQDQLARLSAHSPLGSRLPALIPQMLELGLAHADGGDVCIPHREFGALEAREITGFDDIVPWAPYTLELESSGWIGGPTFRYRYRYYLGTQAVPLTRLGSFVRRGDDPVQRLDAQSYSLIEAIDAFNALPPEAKTGADAFLRFAEVRGLAEGVGAQLDRLLAQERVVVPPRIGLDVTTHEDGRISFVPKLGGAIDAGFQAAFLGQDDVDAVYAIRDERGGRVRVILSDDQREVLRRMQRARRLGGQERALALRDPQAIFDGVAAAVEIDPAVFGPRVKGIGDFPFAAQPYLRRGTGVLDIPPELLPQFPGGHAEAGIRCRYADGSEEDVAFASVDEVRQFAAAVEEAQRTGTGTVDVQGRSVVIDDALVGSARELAAQFTPAPPQKDATTRRFLLIFTNEEELEYEEPAPVEAAPAPAEIPQALAPGTKLKQHQHDGVAWLQRNFLMGRHGCLLADDMGMGKSLQTLTFLAWAIERGVLSPGGTDPGQPPWDPILIVAPVVLIENGTWVEEMRRFFAGEGAIFSPWIILRGAELQRMRRAEGKETQIGDAVLDLEQLRQFRVVITNYETVTNYQHSFARMKAHWSIVVTDEAQEYKVPSTKISHALKSLAPRFRVACTGTPVETRLLDLWNIFDFLQPGQLLGSASQFAKRFERPADDGGAPDLDGVRERLRYGRPDALLLRREKGNHLTDLPEKREHELRCELSPAQRQLHLDLLARARAGGEGSHPFSVISNLMRLYQHPALIPRYEGASEEEALAQCPKLQVLMDTLHSVRARGEKALIFTRHLDMQQLLASVIGGAFGRWPDIVNGAAGGGRKRADMLRGFRQRPGFDVIILSPDVAGMGLTLVEANHVIHYGRWWNPAKEAQATDRAYRIGQFRPVHVYYLIATDPERQFETFDEKLHALILRRRDLAKEFLAPPPADEDLQAELLDAVLQGDAPPPAEPTSAGVTDFDALVAAMEADAGRQTFLLARSGNEGVNVVSVARDGVRVIRCASGPLTNDALRESEQLLTAFAARRVTPIAAGLTATLAVATSIPIPSSIPPGSRLQVIGPDAVARAAELSGPAEALLESRLGSLRDFELEFRRAVEGLDLVTTAAAPAPPRQADPAWVDALFASARYREQRIRHERMALSDERLRGCLRPLTERGGRISRAAFAQRLNVTFSRTQSLLAGMRLLLNLDGADVLTVDESADAILLNVELLRFQFGIDQDHPAMP